MQESSVIQMMSNVRSAQLKTRGLAHQQAQVTSKKMGCGGGCKPVPGGEGRYGWMWGTTPKEVDLEMVADSTDPTGNRTGTYNRYLATFSLSC